MAASVTTAIADHPLAPLTSAEINRAVSVVRESGRLNESARFAYVGLKDPDKKSAWSNGNGSATDRVVRLTIVQGPECDVVEAEVEVRSGELRLWRKVTGVRPALLFEEAIIAIAVLTESPEWQAAMRKRGITDLDCVQIDPWPAGNFGLAHEDERRICRCLSYVREGPEDNGYARPVEGVIAFVDMGRGEVLEVQDHGVVPLPPESGSYLPEDQPSLRTDLRPLEIIQPEGPSFSVEGNLVRWQKWSFRLTMDPYEGLILHTVGYEDAGRIRPVLHRASVCEMVVPYGDPGPLHGWKNAFDAGEWGLGRMTNSLKLGCDCLGEIHYFDAVFTTEQGVPYTLENAVCMHEEDYGILWKH
ncbi:MAG TPA: hypothetical protein VEJ87_16260, partial [Acidimicrobiales bacterium]|nr:hypothetical protein [Acidimicrobiales bacterium]